MKYNFLFFIAVVAMITSCKPTSNSEIQQPDALALHIDSTVKAGDDFFNFANGKWFKGNPIPASETSNGLWQLIHDTIKEQIRNICESAVRAINTKKGSNQQKIGDFFYSGMDSVTLNSKGINDLKSDLDKIDAINNIDGIIKMVSYIHLVSGSPLFSFWVAQDDRNSSKHAIFLWQGGLSLPDRDYYFATDAWTIHVREKFVDHLHNTFALLGYDKAKAKQAADRLMKLETALAKVSRKIEDLRDPIKNYNKVSFTQLTQNLPNISWKLFTENVGLKNVDTVIIGQPEFLKALNGYLKSFPLSDWKNYLKYHLIRRLEKYMDDKTFMESFNFYSNVLLGVKEPKPRWKRVVEQTDGSLGELIGQVYVAEYLSKGTKGKLLEIGNAIRVVYAERIKNLDWMSGPTKEKALKKLNAVIMKVGYPDKWKDLSTLQIDRSSYLRNIMNANRWEIEYMISKFGKPVDRTEWNMQPQTYNAYYSSSNNEIVVPGCNILVPGYERKLADDAILYSVIGGSTFGHELTHGFDDQGCKYDEFGNLSNWWTADDSIKFYTRTKMIVKQFNKYMAVDSLHINGELTQGENIADLGGIIMGYQAFQKTNQFKNNEMIAGLNPSQRFFLGYAMGWMENQRPESVSNQVRSDPHSPVKFRVNGPLSDLPEFYGTFRVKQGDAMWLPDSLRVKIW